MKKFISKFNIDHIYDQISGSLSEIGAKFSLLSVNNVKIIQEKLSDSLNSRNHSKYFYEVYMERFFRDYREIMPHAKSIIIIVYPQKISEIFFNYGGKDIKTIIPPTYIYREEESNIFHLIQKILSKHEYRIENFPFPEKLTTVLSGLGKYGKNNLCYVDGMGSFHTPIIYLSDLPVEDTGKKKLTLASSCKNCNKCSQNCPTNAIDGNSFVIEAEKCMTYFNENEFDLSGNVLSKWQDTIVGCMCCQAVCPMNKKYLQNIEIKARFSEYETNIILKETGFKKLPESLKRKFTELCMDGYYVIIPRNLKLLLKTYVNS